MDADNRGDLSGAIALYSESLSLIDDQIPKVPEEHKAVLAKYRDAYSDRLKVLQGMGKTQLLLLATFSRPRRLTPTLLFLTPDACISQSKPKTSTSL